MLMLIYNFFTATPVYEYPIVDISLQMFRKRIECFFEMLSKCKISWWLSYADKSDTL